MQDAAAHRIEEALGQFRLLVIGEQSDVMKFHLLPDRVRERVGVEAPLQVFDRFGHAPIVELDALA